MTVFDIIVCVFPPFLLNVITSLTNAAQWRLKLREVRTVRRTGLLHHNEKMLFHPFHWKKIKPVSRAQTKMLATNKTYLFVQFVQHEPKM